MLFNQRIRYSSLPLGEQKEEPHEAEQSVATHRLCSGSYTVVLGILVLLLAALNLVQFVQARHDWGSFSGTRAEHSKLGGSGIGIPQLETEGGYMVDEYRSHDDAIADDAWNAIEIGTLLDPNQKFEETIHLWHCLNAIREELMCSGSDELLYIPNATREGELLAGFGQKRNCIDWRALRSWTIDHSACYVPSDDEKAKHVKQWENCVTTDGIILP
ncbi:MAG: hypothetical protein Q9159_003062 [Coniocarpon cinnabarinum]